MKILINPIIHIANVATATSGQAFVSDRYFYIMKNQEEFWVDIIGCEGYYQISNKCNVRSLERKIINSKGVVINFQSKMLKVVKGKLGYVHVGINIQGYKRQVRVHRIFALAFLPNPLNKPQINHINGIKHDNRIENLEWCTPSENRIHALKTGLAKITNTGTTHTNSKLTNEQVLKIRELSAQGMSAPKILKETNIKITSISQICHIIKRKAWKHI
jgi:hypothetical protein